MKKRSVSIRGHKTSFSLEDEFWSELQKIAAGKGVSLAQLVTRIDADRRADENLSSAIRVFVLNSLLGTTQMPETGG